MTSALLRIVFVLAFLAGLLSGQPSDPATGGRLYREHCSPCHGAEGDSIPGVNLRRGEFRRVSTDEELSRLILTGVPGTAMPPSNLPLESRTALVAYIRSLSGSSGRTGEGGDLAAGRTLFETKGCLGCHRVAGKGSRVGPDLSDVGAVRDQASLQASILKPGDVVLPQHRYVRLVTRDGTTITGRRLNEDTHSVQLIDANERLVSILKTDLKEYTLLKTSPMPAYEGKLSAQELAQLISYLSSLKGSQ